MKHLLLLLTLTSIAPLAHAQVRLDSRTLIPAIEDTDGDLIPDSIDACIQVPGNGSESGCPVFDWYTPDPENPPQIIIRNTDRYTIEPYRAIRPGDIIRALIMDPVTREIWSTSRAWVVR